jgi:hypothetical protein
MILKVVSPLEQNMYELHKYYMALYEPLFSDILYLKWYHRYSYKLQPTMHRIKPKLSS